MIKDSSTARKLTLFCSIFGSVKKITQKLPTNYLSFNLRKYKAVIEANFSKGLAAVFHEKLCPHCQLIPDFTRCVLLAYLVSYERCFCKSVFHVQHYLKGCLFHVFCEKMHNTFVFRWMETNEGDEIDVASVARRYHLISQKLFYRTRVRSLFTLVTN